MSQTVYFNNPSQITQLQNLAGTNLRLPENGIPEIEQWVRGVGPYASNINNSQGNLGLDQLHCPTGTSLFQDAEGIAAKMNTIIYGNAFSGQQFFYTTGAADHTGRVSTKDDFFFSASSMKLIGGLVISKMMEEQYFNTNQTISYFLPEFSGNGYYLTSATGSWPSTNAIAFLTVMTGPDFSSWTGTMATLNLGQITLGDAISGKLAHPSYGFSMVGIFNQLWGYNWAQGTTQETNQDFRFAYGQYLGIQAMQRGIALGATGACQSTDALREQYYDYYRGDYSFCTGPFRDYISTCINTIKSGAVPLYNNPLTPDNLWNDGIWGKQSQESYTGLEFGWQLMAACMNVALRRRGEFTSLADYIRAKFFTPMGIDATFAGWEAPAAGNYLEQTFRRYTAISTGSFQYAYEGTDPLYNANAVNKLRWISEYPNDGFAKLSWGYQNVNVQDDYGPDLKSSLRIRIKDFVKFLILIANKGVYNGMKLLSRSAMNYIFCPTSNAVSVLVLGSPLDYVSQNTIFCLGFYLLNGNNPLMEMRTNSNASWAFQVDNDVSFARGGTRQLYAQGVSGNAFFIDLDTGNYAWQATYQSYNAGRTKWESPAQYIAPIMAKYI